MQLPTRAEYTTALGNLGNYIIPPELKPYESEKTQRGGPKLYSGGFAITCPIKHTSKGTKKALRLFDLLPADLEQRYQAISEFVTVNMATGLFAGVVYLREGIVVNGTKYPICYMDWVEGVTLDRYIRENIKTNPAKVAALVDKFAALIETLRAVNAAHGDLSHENIMVTPTDQLVLVDYDGMYVPKLAGFAPCVAGKKNFQNPQRFIKAYAAYFGAYQDNFAAIVLYLTLKALALNPGFYDKYWDDGRILFRKDDFNNPDASPLMRDMEAYPELASMIVLLRQVCKSDLDSCPTLKDFLKGRAAGAKASFANNLVADQSQIFTPEGNPVFDASSFDQEKLMRMQGNVGTLVGRIHKVHVQNDAILCEFTTGVGPASALYIIDDAMQTLLNSGKDAAQRQYENVYVKATGAVQATQIGAYLVPSIEIEDLSQITPISLDEFNAIRRGEEYVKSDSKLPPTWKPPTYHSQPPASRARTPDELFGKASGSVTQPVNPDELFGKASGSKTKPASKGESGTDPAPEPDVPEDWGSW